MSTTVVTTTMGPGGQSKVVVTVDGKTVVDMGPGGASDSGGGAEEGVPPVGRERPEEEKKFLIENYPKCLEDIKVEWLSALLRATVRKMVRQHCITGLALLSSTARQQHRTCTQGTNSL